MQLNERVGDQILCRESHCSCCFEWWKLLLGLCERSDHWGCTGCAFHENHMQQYQQQSKGHSGPGPTHMWTKGSLTNISHPLPCHPQPSLSTNLDLSISASSNAKTTNEQNPLLDILANQAVGMFEHTNQAQVVDGMQLTHSNQCSYEACGVSLYLVPEHCSSC